MLSRGSNQFLLALILNSIISAAMADQDRLFPTSEASKVQVGFKQDGEAVTVTLINSSSMVVTAAKVTCGVPSHDKRYLTNIAEDIHVRAFETVRILPNKTADGYFEVKDLINGCYVVEVRGREKHVYEAW